MSSDWWHLIRRIVVAAIFVTALLSMMMVFLAAEAHNEYYDCFMKSSYPYHLEDLRIFSTRSLVQRCMDSRMPSMWGENYWDSIGIH